MCPKETDGDIGNDRYDFTLQAVQELLKLTLPGRHFEIKAVDLVFHLWLLYKLIDIQVWWDFYATRPPYQSP